MDNDSVIRGGREGPVAIVYIKSLFVSDDKNLGNQARRLGGGEGRRGRADHTSLLPVFTQASAAINLSTSPSLFPSLL